MNDLEWNEWISKLTSHHGKKLTGAQAEFYRESLKHIPAEAWSAICRQWMRSHASAPATFPTIQQIDDGWQDWLQSHPEKRAVRRETHCDECGGIGTLAVEKIVPSMGQVQKRDGLIEPYKATYLYRCGRCRNWEDVISTRYPQITRAQIEAKGWRCLTLVFHDQGTTRMPPVSSQRSGFVGHVSEALEKFEKGENT